MTEDTYRLDPSLIEALHDVAEELRWQLVIDTDQPNDWDARIDVIEKSRQLQGFVGRLGEERDPRHIVVQKGEPPEMLREMLQTLDQHLDAMGVAFARQVSVGVERLVDRAMQALDDENSRLRSELAAAHIEIDLLRRTLETLNEAKATGWRRILVSAAKLVGSVFVVAAAEIGGQAAAGLVTGPPDVDVEIEQPAPSAAGAIDFVRECEALLVEIDALPERLPTAEASS